MLKPTSGSLIEQYTKKIEETEKLLAKIREVSSVLTYQGIERINKVSLFEVKAKHTNEFTIYLGADYYAEVRAEEAIKIFQLRLTRYREMLATIKEKSVQVNSKQMKERSGKQQKAAISQNGGNKNGSFLQVIGEENGENIYNIVEVEGEPEQGDARPVQKQVDSTSHSLLSSGQKLVQSKLPDKPKVQSLTPLEEKDSKGSIQQQQLVNELSQNDEDDDEDGEQDIQTDLIRSHWHKKTGLPAKKELPPIVQKAQSETAQIQHPALPVKQSKQDKVKQKQPSSKTASSKPLPEKISKFKLQKMREKLLKE